jgi:UDP-glucose 4-epimerase
MSLQNKNIIVTGGAGFIGSALVDRIVEEEPNRIVVVDNFFLGSEKNLKSAKELFPQLEVVRLDASDFPAMQDLVKSRRVDTIFDLAVVPLPTSLTYPSLTIKTNIGIATTLCEIARRGEIERLIHFSTSEVYGSAREVPMSEDHPNDVLTPYAASKSAADSIIRSYVETFGIDATIVRPFNNIGPRQNPGSYAGIVPVVIRKVLTKQPIEIFGDGEQTRDLTWVRESADFAVRIHDTPACRGKTLNVATGVETSVNELVRKLLVVLGAESHPIIHTHPRPGDVRRHCADISKLKSLMSGHAPSVISDGALAETVDWYLRELA